MSVEEMRRRDAYMRAQQARALAAQRPQTRRSVPPPNYRPPQQQRPPTNYRPPQQQQQRRSTPPPGYRPPTQQQQRPPTNYRPPQQRPPQQTRPPQQRPPQIQRTPTPAPKAPRPKFTDKVRFAAQEIKSSVASAANNTRSKLGSIPRPSQSQPSQPRPSQSRSSATNRPPVKTYNVAYNPSEKSAAAAAARTQLRSIKAGPSPAEIKRPAPAPKKSTSSSRRSTSIAKTSKPKPKPKATPKPKPAPAPKSAPAPEPVPTPEPTIDLLPPAPEEMVAEITAPAEPSYPVIEGDSIFRRLAELATEAASRNGAPELEILASRNPPAEKLAEQSKALAAEAALKKLIVDAKDGDTAKATGTAVQLAAQVADNANKPGLTPEDVLDLTQSADDLPFVEHKPPSRSAGGGTGDMVISAINQTNFDIDSSKMEFSGNVQIKSPRFAMRCDRFIVHLKADGSGMSYGEGIGNVYIRMLKNGKSTGHEGFSSKAIYRPDSGKLTLSGWPKIREKTKEHVAATSSTQMVLYTDGRVKTLGRNRTVIRN